MKPMREWVRCGRWIAAAGWWIGLQLAAPAGQNRVPVAPPAPPPIQTRATVSAAAAPMGLAATPTLYSIGEPTAEEQLFLEYINRARANPAAEGQRLKNTTDPDVLGAYAYFGVDLNLMASQMAALSPLPPVSMNSNLMAAARAHSQDMFAAVYQSHTGSDGSTPGSRITAQGYVWSAYGECVFANAESVFYGHAGFEVDWGGSAATGGMQVPPGHREIIHSTLFGEVGLGVVLGENTNAAQTYVGPLLVTEDFASRSGLTPFITGVAYHDDNHSQFYDTGEGLGGVTVTVSGASYYAVTAQTGGYSVPVPGAGTYTVTFAAAGWIPYQTNVTVTGTASVKVDYVAVSTGVATLTVLANPPAGGSVSGGGTYPAGTNVQISATASNGWLFVRWADGPTNNPRTVAVTSGSASYTAVFAPSAVLSVLANPVTGGSVTGGGAYVVGSNAVLVATASNGWRFIAWNDGVTNGLRTVTVPAAGASYTANFGALGSVTVQASPPGGGSVTGGGVYFAGSNATVQAAPAGGWVFLNWNGNVTNNPWTFSVAAGSTTCTANFARNSAVTVVANPAGGGSVAGGGIYLSGSNVNLTATPAPGWLFTTWNDGDTNASRAIMVPAANVTFTATFVRGIGAAVDATNLNWVTGGNAGWTVQGVNTRDGVAALRSGAIGAGQQTWFQATTNGPGSLQFWWKVSSAATNQLQFYINTQLVSQISGNVDWNQVVTFLGTSNQVTLKWVYTKNTAAVSGSDAGWVDQVTWMPCPYAEHVPQMFYQDPSGMLASWVLNSTGGFRFARVLANTGGWALKAAGDVDGDGVSDLLFENAGGDTGGWFMNPDGSVRDARFWFNIGVWEIKACGDYEGTGRGQLFFQTPAGNVAYWRLDSNGVYQSSVPLGNMGGWKLRGVGDLDGDRKAELIWQNAAGQIAIWYHNPDGSIRSASPFNTGAWALCGVTDIDGDGISDLLWQTPSGDTGGWFMNSNSTTRTANFWWNTGGWRLKAAGR